MGGQHQHHHAVAGAGQDPVGLGVDPTTPLAFSLDGHLIDNVVKDEEGNPRSFGNFERQRRGVVVALYGDLKRHDLGPDLAEPIDETADGLNPDGVDRILEFARDVIAIGPGLGQSPLTREFVKTLVDRATMPLVIDADGLKDIPT